MSQQPTGDALLRDLLASYEAIDARLEEAEVAGGKHSTAIANLEALLEAHLSVWTDGADELDEWVDGWLTPTFGLDQLLAGWAREPALRSELQALWIGYRRMAMAMEASFEPLVWHDHLAHVLGRVDDHRARRTQADQVAHHGDTRDLLASLGGTARTPHSEREETEQPETGKDTTP